MCPEKHSGTQDFLFEKNYKFETVCRFWGKKFRIFGKNIRQVCPNRNLRDQKNILKNVFLEVDTTLYHLMVFAKKFWLARKFQVPQRGIPRVQLNISRKKFRMKSNHFELWALSKKKTVSWRNSFGRVVNFGLHVFRANFLDKRCLFAKNIIFAL